MGSNETDVGTAGELMLGFAARTGLGSGRPPRRYLWTDAFAVRNFLGLARATGDGQFSRLALRLIAQVHDVLGRHAPGSARRGWLSGLDDHAGAAHPARGGLRIGKKLPERREDEPFDERLEWERDGQYFHYLTQWMHALDQAARSTRETRFNVWARELAEVSHRSFCYGPPGHRRMVWKMSVDLSRPLVPSMGQHDPLDGLLCCAELEATAKELAAEGAGSDMSALGADFASMIQDRDLSTSDPLGLGGLLMDAARIAQLMPRYFADGALLETVLASALVGLPPFVRQGDLERPAALRLAFRELGLAIGLRAVRLPGPRFRTAAAARPAIVALLAELEAAAPLADVIESFWRDPAHQQSTTWSEHRDINEVMLATALAPEGFSLL
jgi:hypothetical protein